jgi:hypothetical protein
MGFFRQPGGWGLLRTAGHLIRDPQLQGMQMKGHDLGRAIP